MDAGDEIVVGFASTPSAHRESVLSAESQIPYQSCQLPPMDGCER